MATKEELETRVSELEVELGEVKEALVTERAQWFNKEYEMLRRMYPYLANELDSFRRGT